MPKANKLQNWIKNRYRTLSENFENKNFLFEEALNLLEKKHEDSEPQARNIFSELQNAGLIKTKKDPKNKRQKIYKLEPIVSEAKEEKELSRNDIDRILKKAADIIRTRVDYTFILLLLFYKRISDKWMADYKRRVEQFRKEGFSQEEAEEEAKEPEYHDLDIPKEYLWEELRKDPLELSANLSKAMKEIANRNEGLRNIFTQFDFIQFTQNRENNEILRQLFELFSSYSLEKADADILGDAYEFILRHFAPEKAKEGEVYTNREAVETMVRILGPQPGESIYDGSAGSGGMLIKSYEYVRDSHGKDKADTLFLYGQEYNPRTLALAHMNLLIHDVKNGLLEQGDTLINPKFQEKGKLKHFDKAIFNPPWNQKGYGEEQLKKAAFSGERFPFGFTNKQSADWAWMQHFYASLKSEGKLAAVLDTGAVSRGSGSKSDKEKTIRQKFVDNDLVEAVILMPENLFYNTSAPGIIMVVNKAKPEERKNKILLINASKEFEKGRPKNYLTQDHIKKITETYHKFRELEGFSTIITNDQAQEADYNLSPSRFVFALDTTEHRPIKEIVKDLEEVEREEKENRKELDKILSKLK
jgi:type I restriction enzyme M protein